jgi:hypothetical protein
MFPPLLSPAFQVLFILLTTIFSFCVSCLGWLDVICKFAPLEMLLTGLNVLTLGVDDILK